MVEDRNLVQSYVLDTMAVDEFAFRLINEDHSIQVIDFRPPSEYQKVSLPNSTSFTIDNLFEKEPSRVLAFRHKTNVFVADDEAIERQIAVIAAELGHGNVQVLRGGFNGFQNQILRFRQTPITRSNRPDSEEPSTAK